MAKNKIEFGLRLPVAGPLTSPSAVFEATEKAVANGWNALWVHDFIVWTRFLDLNHVSCGSREAVEAANAGPNFTESLTNLAYLAGITRGTDIKLGVAVLCMPYRNPIVAGRQITNIDWLSDGRVIFGVGVGAPANRNNRDFEVLGVSRTDKYRKTTEYVHVIQEMWKDGPAEFKGEFINFEPTEFFPKPVQKPGPPIWIGGGGDKAMNMICDFGSGWLPGVCTPEQYAEKLVQLEGIAKEKGKSGLKVTNGIEITTCVARTRDEAMTRANKTLTSRTEGYPLTMDQVVAYSLLGSVEDVRDRCIEYVKAGVDHFEIKPIYHNLKQLHEQIELFGKEIIPAVNAAVSAKA